ncbi:MAG: glycoside hydrolase family 113 [Promethearchaeota archaeon]
MKIEKKKILLILVVISFGSLFTFISSFNYYNSVKQKGILYENIPFQRGISFTTWGAYSFNSTEAYEEIIEMKEIGIEWVGANIWWLQESVSSTEIYSGSWTDTSANITAFFDFIHSQGMKVFFKPMLDTEDGIWRSYIEASPEWLKEYKRFIKYTAEIAENGSAEILSIGCEMGSWQVKIEAVNDLITEVREIYSGLLTYAANHDSFSYIEWWDKVDIIGIDAYFPFTLSYEPTLEDMIEVWNGFYDELNRFQRKWQRPIIFAEIGCQNRDGCNIAPNDNKFNLNQDEEEFQMFYESLFKSQIWTAPWFKGTYWWIWDCRDIDELEDNGFTPQLPIIKSTIHKYYTEKREIIYPNYWLDFIMILILGGLITFISALLVHKFIKIEKKNFKSDKIDEKKNIQEEKKDNTENNNYTLAKYILINGSLFGVFIFWAFTYYNEILFKLLYSSVTKAIFLNGGTVFIFISILIALIAMLLLWILLQRLVYKKIEQRIRLICYIALSCSILIFIIEAYQPNTLSNEISLRFFVTLQVMIILGILFTFTFMYGFPHQLFSNIEKKEKIQLLFKIILSTIALSSMLLILLSIILKNYIRVPSLLIGIFLLLLIPLIHNYFLVNNPKQEEIIRKKHLTLKERLIPNQLKVIEALLCLFALSYYIGVLRYYDNHTLINFNLILLPDFFIPIGFSLLIAIPMVLGFYVIARSKYPALEDKLSLNETLNNSKNELIIFLFKLTIYFSIIILIAGWFFQKYAFEIALIFGGIPILMIFLIFMIGNVSSENIFGEKTSWKRLTIYLIIILTIAFSVNGIMVGLLYLITFLTIENGQVVVRIAFGEELGFDAIQLIYNIQLLISLIPILIYLLFLKIIVPKIRT